MRQKNDISNRKKTQTGAASIEFAFIFVLMFVLFYGLISYAIPLMLAAAYQQLSAEAVRQAVGTPNIYHYQADSEDPRIAAIKVNAEQKAMQVINDSWLPPGWANSCGDYSGGFLKVSGDGSEWSACVRHATPASIMPALSLLGWQIPQLPEEIRGEARLRIR
ncbi:TadE family protein [Zobellella iuensis]|uniref:Pilus assembly protein n=1 Tax=Zobellella iuensis TaxID=2803811 RepID=A0ABS1QP26_9GAMM|nr:TadE family protein [Zobellella iuensis]MBL1376610.1 pilus assembly protein [Zobellella iuensis]